MQAATALFNACEAGKGWAECAQYCAPDATFDCQAVDLLPGQPPITGCKTMEAYTQWMKGIVEDLGDKATFEVNSVARWQNLIPSFPWIAPPPPPWHNPRKGRDQIAA